MTTISKVVPESWLKRLFLALACLAVIGLAGTACTSSDPLSEAGADQSRSSAQGPDPGGSDLGGSDQGGSDQSGSDQSGSDQGGNDDSQGRARGFPGGEEDDSEAVGAPIKLPAFADGADEPVQEIRQRIEQDVQRQCGGYLCITFVEVPTDEWRDMCTFARTDPELGSDVKRGSTVVIETGKKPCEETPGRSTDDNGTDTSGSDQGSDEDGTDEGGTDEGGTDQGTDEGGTDQGGAEGSNDEGSSSEGG